MPVYVYRNLRTGETFEVEQRITEPALTQHPESGDPVKRLIQPVGIAFKGSGFYVTDSRGSGPGKAKAKSDDAGGTKESNEAKGSKESSGGSSEPSKAGKESTKAGTGKD